VPIAREDVAVTITEHLGTERCADDLRNFERGRPDVLQEDRFALLVGSQRFLRQVEIHRAGDGIGHHQRRGSQIVRLHLRADAALEIAVAREYCRRDEIAARDCARNCIRQRTGISDTGRAAIADEVEAELVEFLLKPGRLEIFAHHLAAGRE